MPRIGYRGPLPVRDLIMKRGGVTASLRQRGQRLGQVNFVRPGKRYPQAPHSGRSRKNLRVRSRDSVLTTWSRCSSISRSGSPSRAANCRVFERRSVSASINRCRIVPGGEVTMAPPGHGRIRGGAGVRAVAGFLRQPGGIHLTCSGRAGGMERG